MTAETPSLKQYLSQMLTHGASDLHVSVGAPIQIRVDGMLTPMTEHKLNAEQAKALCYECLTPEQKTQFEKEWELDLAIPLDETTRFRVNLFFQQESVAGAFRPIPTKIPDAEKLGIPEAALRLADKPRGLVLVTGPTGSGKSTSLAAMIKKINQAEGVHIITIEDPVEFVHTSMKALVVQREVEKDTKTFGAALKRVLRQDPDVVLIGEMRDLETIAAAITIAETGHLVFGTLHTNSAAQTINRIIDVFPPHQQPQIRTQLSFILEGICSQQLIPKIGGGRALAMELFIPNPAIRNLIREDKIHQLYAAMQMGQDKSGMITMSQCLASLVKKGTVAKETALSFATEYEELKKLIGGG